MTSTPTEDARTRISCVPPFGRPTVRARAFPFRDPAGRPSRRRRGRHFRRAGAAFRTRSACVGGARLSPIAPGSGFPAESRRHELFRPSRIRPWYRDSEKKTPSAPDSGPFSPTPDQQVAGSNAKPSRRLSAEVGIFSAVALLRSGANRMFTERSESTDGR